jgi:Glycosyltransferase family 87
VIGLLLISIPAYRLIPSWGKPWGLDLRNVYVFHACAGKDDPYLVTGAQCGDPFGRAMPYPPLMYWALVWMRWVSLPAARWIWASFITAVLLWAAWVWSRPEPGRRGPGRWPALAFGALLVTQFPAVFAIERGNNDTFCVLLWTAAVTLYLADRRFLSGCAAGLAAAAKLYPAVSCAVLVAGLAGVAFRGHRDPVRRGAAIRLAAGMLVAPTLATLILWTQTRHYLERVLPTFAAHLPGESLHSHSLPATLGPRAWAVSGLLIAAWCVASFLRFERAPVEIFAGALAVSTYVAGTSFDYNLVTVHPLLIVLVARALDGDPRSQRAPLASLLVLLLGLAAVTAHRGWFGDRATLHVGLQIAWVLAAAGLAAARRAVTMGETPKPPAQPEGVGGQRPPETALQPEAEAR